MEYDDIIDFLFNKLEDDDLFPLENTKLHSLDEKMEYAYKELMKFIDKKVHPKCRKKLKKLINEYYNAKFESTCIENKLFYRYGYSDGTKNIITALSINNTY